MRTPYPTQVQFYFAASTLLDKSLTLISAIWIGVWLGVLDKNALHAIDKRCYDQWRMYHGRDYNLSGLRSWEQQAIDRYFGDCKKLLVAGAGGGREVLALCRMGYEVDSFECHPELVMFANQLMQEEGWPFRITLTPRDECLDSASIYDGLLIGWGAFMLIQGRQKRIAFLQKLREKVSVGSPLLLSFFERGGKKRSFQVVRVVANGLRWLLRRSRVEMGDSLAPNYVHYFTEEEIRSELHQAGFELVFYGTKEYGHAVAAASPLA